LELSQAKKLIKLCGWICLHLQVEQGRGERTLVSLLEKLISVPGLILAGCVG